MIRLVESTAWPPQGPVNIFQEPLPNHVYVIGADPAEGLEHGDAAAASVIDADTGLLVATYWAKIDPDLFGQDLAVLGRFYNTALIAVEINNHGHVTVLTLRKLGYPRLFRRRTIGNVTEGFTPQFGWHTNKVSKPKMIEGLGAAIRDRSIDIRCSKTLAELRTYIREYTQAGTVRMHGSPYDDRTMSLAIAWQMVDYVHVEYPQEEKKQKWDGDWWVKQTLEANSPSNDVKPLGWQSTTDRRL